MYLKEKKMTERQKACFHLLTHSLNGGIATWQQHSGTGTFICCFPRHFRRQLDKKWSSRLKMVLQYGTAVS